MTTQEFGEGVESSAIGSGTTPAIFRPVLWPTRSLSVALARNHAALCALIEINRHVATGLRSIVERQQDMAAQWAQNIKRRACADEPAEVVSTSTDVSGPDDARPFGMGAAEHSHPPVEESHPSQSPELQTETLPIDGRPQEGA